MSTTEKETRAQLERGDWCTNTPPGTKEWVLKQPWKPGRYGGWNVLGSLNDVRFHVFHYPLDKSIVCIMRATTDGYGVGLLWIEPPFEDFLK
jgi:hypothetical protein